MAVYTPLDEQDIESFLTRYDAGRLLSFKGIAEGIENTNYLVFTPDEKYILTVFEQRVNPKELPFFLGLTEYLAARGIHCPRPMQGKDGKNTYTLKNKPAALIEFLEGRGSPHITPRHLELVGDLIAKMHLATKDFSMTRKNTMALSAWKALFERFRRDADTIFRGLEKDMAQELDWLEQNWPKDLPSGVIHADIFPDNIFFIDGNTDRPELSGVIDFYFACNDFWMYDLVIAMNAWCFDTGHHFVKERADALLSAYDKIRTITDAECEAMPILARGAAMRFLATRTYDWLNQPPGALVNPKDPMEYVAKLRFHQEIRDWRDYSPVKKHVHIYTDGACSGNPGPGGWGAILVHGDKEKEISGAENPTTNNRMELMAAIAGLEALKTSCRVDVTTDSQYVQKGITEWLKGWKKRGWKTADKKPVKNADLWQRLEEAAARHDVRWHWVRGHDGHHYNERADQLAVAAIKLAK